MSKPNSSLGRSRDLNIEGAGKGDKSRVTNQKAYAENFSQINWGTPKAVINPAWVNAPYPAYVENFEDR